MGVLFITALIITADQISKSLVKSTMTLYDIIPVIPGFFQLNYITNKGMAFGINLPVGISFFSGIHNGPPWFDVSVGRIKKEEMSWDIPSSHEFAGDSTLCEPLYD